MDFTREPIIESVITPKDGCKLVVRSSKAASQEEFFVDSVEVVSFGHSLYFRSSERPKSFFVPAGDYEILEVREARLVLKNVGLDRSTIKIGGGREVKKEKEEASVAAPSEAPEARGEKKQRESKRRHTRRRRSKNDPLPAEETKEFEPEEAAIEDEVVEKPRPVRSGLLPPPSTLISETIARYKDNALFKDAFFLKDEDEVETETEEFTLEESPAVEEEQFPAVSISQSDYGSFEMTEEEEEEIYRQRQKYQENEDDDHIPPKVNDDLIGESSEIESNTNQ